MDTGKQILEDSKRQDKVQKGEVNIQFTFGSDKLYYFDVLGDEGKIKYMGRIDLENKLSTYCTCPDFLHRSNEIFVANHGHVMNCKHLRTAKGKLGVEIEE